MPDVWLKVSDGPDTGREWRIEQGLVVGRGYDSDVMLSDPAISRRHASVVLQGETAIVEDLGSSNGTFVNGERVAEPRRVAEDDVIQVGGSELQVRVGPTETHTTPGEPTEVHPPPRRTDSGKTLS